MRPILAAHDYPPDDVERFWAKVEKTDGCWNWKGYRASRRGKHTYGMVMLDGSNALAHRVAYAWTVGPIPPGYELHHTCDNKGCVNPEHWSPSAETAIIPGNPGYQRPKPADTLKSTRRPAPAPPLPTPPPEPPPPPVTVRAVPQHPVWLGVDPGLGGGNAVIACQPSMERLYVVDLRVDYGLSKTEEQLERIEMFAGKYRPSVCIIEYDAQQKGLGNDDRLRAMAARHGFEVRPHLTRGQKIDQVFGVAAMNQSFIKREISIPWGDEETRRIMEPLVSQLRSWRPDVPTKRLRQDAVMSIWFCWRYWMNTRVAHRRPAVAAPAVMDAEDSLITTDFDEAVATRNGGIVANHLLRELMEALGEPLTARAATPQTVWSEMLTHVRALAQGDDR